MEEKNFDFRRSKAKRVVFVKFLADNKSEIFRTCTDMYTKYGKEKIGISLQALWNVLSKSGFYENKKCVVYYQNIQQIKPIAWE